MPATITPPGSHELALAIATTGLVLHVQPVVRLADGHVEAMEALLRWRHRTRGLLTPGAFLAVAEANGLMEPIDSWVLGAACRLLRDWDAAGVAPVRIGVNLAARELTRPGLPAQVAAALSDAGLEVGRLVLEVAPPADEDREATAAAMDALRAVGAGVVLDGVRDADAFDGLPVDAIKLDGPLVRLAHSDEEAAAALADVLACATDRDLPVVACGVESPEQLAHAGRAGCVLAQGWLFAPALPPHEAAARLVPEAPPRPSRRPWRRRATA